MLHEELPELPFIKLCEGVVGDGKAYFREAVAQGFEGVVAKRLTSRYLPNGRGMAWRRLPGPERLVAGRRNPDEAAKRNS
jgi:ATP-dependent DNA ligase